MGVATVWIRLNNAFCYNHTESGSRKISLMPTHQPLSKATVAQVRAQCDRILASRVFALAKRHSAFLNYVVNAKLEGRADQLKEFTLGIDVFEKDENFDPSSDSIVRVEASRLRAKLREYYEDEGAGDLLRIDIPKGHYVPVFRPLNAPHVAPHSRQNLYLGVVITIFLLVIAFVYFGNQTTKQEPNLVTESEQLPSPSSLAVLPLRDWSRLPEEYFSEAMTDAIISSLAKIPTLRVTSLTSVMQYSDTETPIPEIGRALGVAYILEGSIFHDNELVRITTQLIASDTDEHVWSSTFERPMLDLLSMQNEVATAVAAQISDELLPSSTSPAEPMNPAAYDAYMKGRYFFNQFTANGYRRGMHFFQEAINIEPDYAEAYAGLASCHCLLAGHGLELVSPVIAIPQAHAMALKALSINPDLAEPHAFLGIINFKFDWDTDAAEAMLARAIDLNPSLYQAYVWQSQLLEAMSRNEEAIDRARYAKQLNPLSLAASLNLGWQMYQAGKYIEASAEIDSLIEFNPTFWGGHWARGHIYKQHEMYGKAIEEFELAIKHGGGHSLSMSALGHTFAVAGMLDEAREIITELETLSKDVYVSPFHVATVYAGLNEADSMFEWLERAYLVRARSLAWLHVVKEMKPYHHDARFQSLLQRIGVHSNSDPKPQAPRNL